jgi:hypothetical protein
MRVGFRADRVRLQQVQEVGDGTRGAYEGMVWIAPGEAHLFFPHRRGSSFDSGRSFDARQRRATRTEPRAIGMTRSLRAAVGPAST